MSKSSELLPRYPSVFFIQTKSVPIWIVIIVSIFIFLSYSGTSLETKDEQQARDLLKANAEILATILAVTMSFMILGLQFLAESYTPRALASYMKDKVVYGFPILYIALISFNLLSATFPTLLAPTKAVQFAMVGTSVSLVYLAAFTYYIIYKIQPERHISETSKMIRQETFNYIINNEGRFDISSAVLKPYMILEQTMIKSIDTNDIFSFAQGLNIMFERMDGYLGDVHERFVSDKNSTAQGWDSFYIYGFFFRLFSQLTAECFRYSREHFIVQFQWHLFNSITKVYSTRNHRAIEDFWQQLAYVGQKVFHLEMQSAGDLYLRQLHQFMKLELQTAKETEQDLPQDPLGLRRQTEYQIENVILTQNFELQ